MYNAIISKIQTSEHPNADRLLLGRCMGFQVIVGIHTQDGQLGVFFPCDGQLSDEYCKANDLYPQFDEQGKRIGGGFIDPKNKRVRAQNFRGKASEGLWMPLESLSSFGDIASLKEGDTFVAFNGQIICNKWINKATRNAINGKQVNRNRKETPWLCMHPDTAQLKYKIKDIPAESLVTITEKLHGTSQRSGWSLETTKVPFFKWLTPLMKFEVLHPFISYEKEEYIFLNGTRRVLVPTFSNYSGYYGNTDFRYVHEQQLEQKLPQGFQLYYEVVGWESDERLIMPECANSKVSPEFVETYGETTKFTYGCEPGVSKMYAYALTYTSPKGQRIRFNYLEMSRLCALWGIPVVPVIDAFIYDERVDLITIAHQYSKGVSSLDARHIREGVCLEITPFENESVYYLKDKSSEFYILEDVIKSDESAVDVEELESYV